jgi:hypothetical protein
MEVQGRTPRQVVAGVFLEIVTAQSVWEAFL